MEIARACVTRAGLDGFVEIVQHELAELVAPDPRAEESVPGLVAINPPYGERLEARGGLGSLYRELSDRLRSGFGGWMLAVITPDEHLEAGLGLSAEQVAPLYNGRILTQARVFRVPKVGSPGAEPLVEAPHAPLGDAARDFANRLRKNVRHLEKWARRSDVTCYRVYDADLPDYAVAIDLYSGTGPDAGSPLGLRRGVRAASRNRSGPRTAAARRRHACRT